MVGFPPVNRRSHFEVEASDVPVTDFRLSSANMPKTRDADVQILKPVARRTAQNRSVTR